jgi:hypothetical protein
MLYFLVGLTVGFFLGKYFNVIYRHIEELIAEAQDNIDRRN